MKLNILHISDTDKLVSTAILAVDNELAHRRSENFRAILVAVSTNLHSARAGLKRILDQDVEGRKWS